MNEYISCDYRYDAHDRLIGADYTPAATDSVGEDFSTSYSYDAIGRPLTLRRYGVIGIDGTVERFGLLDALTYSYSGALPSSISRQTEATEFYGRTGAVATELGFNEAGLLTSDAGRELNDVRYNRLGLPRKIEISNKNPLSPTKIEQRVYTSDGKLISVSENQLLNRIKIKLGHRTHIGQFTFAGGNYSPDTLMRVDFPGGYFDGSGVHWMLADAIGSVELVIDGKGRVEQHTGYYPYGEPWREPAGQPYLFGGKERRRFASLGDSDFHARFLTTATALWQAPDVHAGKYPWLSPWVFCNANPIRYVDPTGMDTYVMTSYGKVIERIKVDEYDSILLKLNDGTELESSRLPKGTIQEQWKDETTTENDYFQIKGDDNSTYIFEFLAKNTDVEYSHVQTGEEGDNAVNYISTSHLAHKDYSGGNIMEATLKKDIDFGNGIVIKKTGDVRSHTHNHPISPNPSTADYEMTRRYQEYPHIKYSIFTKSDGYRAYGSQAERK